MPVIPQRRGDLQSEHDGGHDACNFSRFNAASYTLYFLGGAVSKALTTELLHSSKQIPTPSYREECPLGATILGVQMLLTLGGPQDYSRVYFQVKSENLG